MFPVLFALRVLRGRLFPLDGHSEERAGAGTRAGHGVQHLPRAPERHCSPGPHMTFAYSNMIRLFSRLFIIYVYIYYSLLLIHTLLYVIDAFINHKQNIYLAYK